MKTKPDNRAACTLGRRQFIRQAALAGAGAFVLPRFSIGQAGPPASSRVNFALIGCGLNGRGFVGNKNENLVAICDVDSRVIAEAKAKHAHIAGAKEFSDFRVMFDKMEKEIDAVLICTPDNTHFPATMEALGRGKHVLTQKPLTHNVWEARTLAKAAAKAKVKTVMGNQGHTFDGIREMREWYEAGILGTVSSVDAWFPGPTWITGDKKGFFRKPSSFPPQGETVPKELDWDLWLGPSEPVPFNPIYTPLTWRGFWNFGSGMIGDWFCHICDGPVWILDLYEPTVIEAEKIDGPNEGMCPDGSVVRFDFPARGDKPACTMRWHDGGNTPKTPSDWSWGSKQTPDGPAAPPRSGSLWKAAKGDFYLDERSNKPRLTSREKTVEMKKSGAFPAPKYPRVKGGPADELFRAIKGEGPDPGSDFAYASKLTEIACLGVLAQRFGGRIEWDAKTMRVTNRPELNDYVKEPVRKGWEYGEELWKA
jgi:predicted dehydrogenase